MKLDIELTEEAEERVRNQADAKGIPVSDYVVELIERWLSREEANEAFLERFRPAK